MLGRVRVEAVEGDVAEDEREEEVAGEPVAEGENADDREREQNEVRPRGEEEGVRPVRADVVERERIPRPDLRLVEELGIALRPPRGDDRRERERSGRERERPAGADSPDEEPERERGEDAVREPHRGREREQDAGERERDRAESLAEEERD